MEIGDWKNSEAIKVVRPNFNKEIFPDAIKREGVEKLTLRAEEAGMLLHLQQHHRCGVGRRGPPLVDEDCHARCRAIYKGVDGAEWRERALHACGDERGSRCS